jgi:hypothetical protein
MRGREAESRASSFFKPVLNHFFKPVLDHFGDSCTHDEWPLRQNRNQLGGQFC